MIDNLKKMAKAKSTPQTAGPPHLRSRVSYLHQAATYLAGLSAAEVIGKQSTIGPTTYDLSKYLDDRPPVSLPITPISHSAPNKDYASSPSVIVSSEQPGVSAVYDEAGIRRMLSQIEGISRKGQVRLSSSMKHSMCKRCHLLLVQGRNATQQIENKSRGGKKPWADVLVVTCNACGTAKRFPVGAKRQPSKKDRMRQTAS